MCSRVRSGLGPSRAEVGLALALLVVLGASVCPPSSGRCLACGPSAFFPLALSGFARSGLGALVLVFLLFSRPLLRSPPRVRVQ